MTEKTSPSGPLPALPPPFRLEVGALAHPGLIRERQEDAHVHLPELGLVAVADGMGGHLAGHVASGLAIEALRDHFDRQGTQPRGLGALLRKLGGGARPGDVLADAVRQANRRVLGASRRDRRHRGMGTTLVVAWLCGDRIHFAHVGDSRIYHFERAPARLTQITEDHSLLNDYLRRGVLTSAEVATFPYKNVIVRAIGLAAGVEVDVGERKVEADDQFLLCSDGLTDLVDDATIRAALQTGESPDATARRLVDLALSAGGLDNVTAVVARIRPFVPEYPEVKDEEVPVAGPDGSDAARGVAGG